jgi:hypothetical protein
MAKITYKCINGHQTTLERDGISRASIVCEQCGELIDRFNSNSIVGNVYQSDLTQNVTKPKNIVSRLILVANIKRVQVIAALVIVGAAGLMFGLQLLRQNPPQVDSDVQSFVNQIEDIAYTSSIETSHKLGVYKIHFVISNLGKENRNQPPLILMDFYPEINKDAASLPQILIPTAVFHPLEYAQDDEKKGFTSKEGVVEIEFPKGTRNIATCLSYIGVADMKSDRCQEKILNQLSPKTSPSKESK